jgi:hypothetical protein
MNTVRFFTTALVGIVTTCVLSVGAASAQPVPDVPKIAQVSSPSQIAAEHVAGNAGAKAQLLLKQKSYIERAQRDDASDEAAVARARAAQKHARGSYGGSLVAPDASTAGEGSTPPSQHSGDGSEVPVLAVTALAGLALGAVASSASRRLRHRPGMAA